MADAVAVRTLLDDNRRIGVLLTSVSDGTGESAVTKITKASVTKAFDGKTAGGITPVALDLEYISWTVATFTSVDLFWKATTPDRIMRLPPGSGFMDLTGQNVLNAPLRADGAKDPISSGNTGDITLTSSATANGIYAIVLWFRKRIA